MLIFTSYTVWRIAKVGTEIFGQPCSGNFGREISGATVQVCHNDSASQVNRPSPSCEASRLWEHWRVRSAGFIGIKKRVQVTQIRNKSIRVVATHLYNVYWILLIARVQVLHSGNTKFSGWEWYHTLAKTYPLLQASINPCLGTLIGTMYAVFPF